MEKVTTNSSEVFNNFLKKQSEYDITKFQVLNGCFVGEFLIARIKYEGFNDYDGTKVFVWKGLTQSEFNMLDKIDPRFDPMSKLFAVFHPTKDGYNAAIDFARTYDRIYQRPWEIKNKLYET